MRSIEIAETSRIKKLGYFYADRDIFEKIQAATGTNGCRHPLCYILEAADDIAYLTADIEDAYRKGFISYRLLLEELRSEDVLTRMLPQEQNTYLEMVNRLERKYDSGIKRGVADPEGYAVSNWIVNVQGFLIACATYGFTKNYRAIMEGSFPTDLFSRATAARCMTVSATLPTATCSCRVRSSRRSLRLPPCCSTCWINSCRQ